MRLLTVAMAVTLGLPLPLLGQERLSSGRLAQQPERYYGDYVEVTGQIARVLDGRALTLDEDRPFVRHDLLVLVPRSRVRLEEGDEVVVSGYVRRLDAEDLRRDYDWLDDAVPADILMEDAGKRPVVIAHSVTRDRDRDRDRRDRDRADRDLDRDDRDRDRDDDEDKRRSRLILRDDDEAETLAVGRRILLSEARVEQLLGRTTFLVRDDDGRERVVRVERHSLLPSEGERLDISGVVRRVPTDIETWDLESEAARRLVRSKGLFVEARRLSSTR